MNDIFKMSFGFYKIEFIRNNLRKNKDKITLIVWKKLGDKDICIVHRHELSDEKAIKVINGFKNTM